MKSYKDFRSSTQDIPADNIYIVMLKSIALCLVLSLAAIIVYAFILSYTTMSDASMSKITQTIVIISIAVSGIYGGKRLKKKGWLFGLALGLIFVLLLVPISIAFGQQFILDKYFIVKMLMGSSVGLIGGVIGVNLS
ncbi:MAG: TIGR04086 family membrane protein [Bacillota bacterium]